MNVCMSGYKNGFRDFVSCVIVDLTGAKTFSNLDWNLE